MYVKKVRKILTIDQRKRQILYQKVKHENLFLHLNQDNHLNFLGEQSIFPPSRETANPDCVKLVECTFCGIRIWVGRFFNVFIKWTPSRWNTHSQKKIQSIPVIHRYCWLKNRKRTIPPVSCTWIVDWEETYQHFSQIYLSGQGVEEERWHSYLHITLSANTSFDILPVTPGHFFCSVLVLLCSEWKCLACIFAQQYM